MTRVPVVALLLLAVVGCSEPPNQPPFITAVDGPRTISARDSATYQCQAQDPEGRPLTYTWSFSAGSVARESAGTILWYTPDTSARAVMIRLGVEDDSGLVARDSLTVKVLRDTAVFIPWWEGAVKRGEYTSWQGQVWPGDTLFGRTGTVDTFGDVYLMVLDEANYQRWTGGETPEILMRRVAYAEDTFSVAMPLPGPYRVVIDNIAGDADYNYAIFVQSVGP